ncbi:MAG: ABC transporter ATP-binding protein [Rhizobiales bacterium]|nr:ABC transporter ATP-binding protein [Hyphomicrobiales bacterium]
MARVELIDVSKRWGEVTAVDRVDLAIEDGEFVAILGPSGCGKSTTLFLLAGIYAPSDGELRFDGELINEIEAKDRNVGVVFQSYALYPHMNVRKNIMFPLKFQGVAPVEARRRAEEAARLVHVEELLERMPPEMSGGQQQRVALARALVKQPQLLLLDEPLSNLDATLRLTMRSEIRALHRRLGVTSILVTHDQLEATTMADRVVCMRAGRIEQVGTPDELYKRPASLFVAGFIGAPPITLMRGNLSGGALNIGDTVLACRGANGTHNVTLGVRPEALRFAEAGIEGRITEIEPMGRETLYFIDSALGPMRLLEAGADVHHSVGEAVHLQFDEADTILFDRETERRIDGAHVSPPH